MNLFLDLRRCGTVLALAIFTLSAACGGSNNIAGQDSGNGDACGNGGCLDTPDTGVIDASDVERPDTQEYDPGYDNGTGPDADECKCQSTEMPWGFGCPCEHMQDCVSQFCVLMPDNSRQCTTGCIEKCPCGWECKQVMMGGESPWVCMPYQDPLCNKLCLSDSDCGIDALCAVLEADKGGTKKYCLQACDDENAPCPLDYTCTDVTNSLGDITSKQCVPLAGHCDCRPKEAGDPPIDYLTDANHCGSCESTCAYANGTPYCDAGNCTLAGCLEGFMNLDGQDDNGCEYGCVYKAGEDLPDPDSVAAACPGENCFDANCDGLDGNISKGVFVDGASGADEFNTWGDQARPFKTITAAIAFADVQDPKKEVYVAAGQYREKVILKDGVSVFGGYARGTWKREIEKNKTQISWDGQETLAIRAVIASGIISMTFFDGFFIKSFSATQASASSYGIFIFQSSSALKIQNCTIEPGKGADGRNGAAGKAGLNGGRGGDGAGSFEYDSCGLPIGCNSANYPGQAVFGVGGISPCGMTGGNGGRGGSSSGSGVAGSAGANNGGTAGMAGGPTNAGSPGGKGTEATAGANGGGGTSGGGPNLSGDWEPAHGEDGADGQNGMGGGGGGGGGGDNDCVLFFNCGSAGGSGGGGGGGGCGGTGGKKGTGGGGSFGVFIVQSSPVIKNCLVASDDGGNGGNGGLSGAAGLSGTGGNGGGDTEGPGGGGGGDGGIGGAGGHGGGGSGGPTYPIYIVGNSSSPTCDGNTYEINGFPGVGGQSGDPDSSTNKGSDGVAGNIYGATPTCLAP
jgi:hypothetical protein